MQHWKIPSKGEGEEEAKPLHNLTLVFHFSKQN